MWLSPVPRLSFLALIALGIHTLHAVCLWSRKDVFIVQRFWPCSSNWIFFVLFWAVIASSLPQKVRKNLFNNKNYKVIKNKKFDFDFHSLKALLKFPEKKLSHKSSVVDLDLVESVPFGTGIIFLYRIRHFWRTNLYNIFTNLYFVFNLKALKSLESLAVVQLCTFVSY